MPAIGYERAYAHLKTCARRAHELEARQQALREEAALLRRELDAMQARYDEVRAERHRASSALTRRRTELKRLERFLETLPDERARLLLRLRYLEGRTVPQVRQALEARGVFLGQRHLERLLSKAEQDAAARWDLWMQKEGSD